MNISNVFVCKRYLGIDQLICFSYKLQKNKFYQNLITTDYPETTHFPQDFNIIIPKCQGIRICNDNTRVTGEQNRIRLVRYNFRKTVNI